MYVCVCKCIWIDKSEGQMDDTGGQQMKNKVSTLPKENTNDVKVWMQEADDDAKGLP